MRKQRRISVAVPATTKDALDRSVERYGLEQNVVVERALLAFMRACVQLPDEALIPTRYVLDDEAFDRLVVMLEAPAVPTLALRELMRGPDR